MSRPPAFQFYPGDYLRDAKLLRVSLAARGLWVAMLCLMHQEGDPYGHLRIGGHDLTVKELARIVGERESTVKRLLDELEHAHVFSRTCGEREPNVTESSQKSEEILKKSCAGTIYSRRMVRDEDIRRKRAAGGIHSLDNPNVPRPKSPEQGSGEGPKEGYPQGYPHPPSSGGSPSSSVFNLQSSISKEREGVKTPLAPLAIEPEQLAILWNQIPGIKAITFNGRLPDTIRTAALFRIKKHNSVEFWDGFLLRIKNSAWLTGKINGEDGTSFHASFDWAMKPEKFDQIIAGSFDDTPNQLPKKRILLT